MPVTPISEDNLLEFAAQPASASADGRSATAHSLASVVEALKFLAAQNPPGTNSGGGRISPWRAAVSAVGIPQNSRGY